MVDFAPEENFAAGGVNVKQSSWKRHWKCVESFIIACIHSDVNMASR